MLDRCLDRIAGEPGAAAIWRVWADAVGPQIARRAEPIRLRGRTLLVAVSSAPWMQELQLLKRTVLGELGARLQSHRDGTPLVSDLFFVLTSLGDGARDAVERTSDGRHAATRRPRDCPAPPAAPDLAGLPDELRASLAGIATAWQRRARS